MLYNDIDFYIGKMIRRPSLYIYCWDWHFYWTFKEYPWRKEAVELHWSDLLITELWNICDNLRYVHANRLQNIYEIYFKRHEFNANCTPVLYLWSAFVDTSMKAMTAHWREVLPKVTPPQKPPKKSDFYYQRLSSPWPILLIQPKPSIRPTALLATLNWVSSFLSKYFPWIELIREGCQRGLKTPDARSKAI